MCFAPWGREGQGGASIRRIRPKTRSRTKIIKGCFSLFFRSYTPFCALSLTQILLETSYITFFCSRMQKTSYIAMRLFCVQQLKKLPTTTHRIVVYSCWSADPSHGKSFKSVQVSALFFRWHGAACPKNAFLCILVDKINVENMRKHRKHLLFQQGGVLLKCASNPRAEGGGGGIDQPSCQNCLVVQRGAKWSFGPPYFPGHAAFCGTYVPTPVTHSLRSQGGTSPTLPAGFRNQILSRYIKSYQTVLNFIRLCTSNSIKMYWMICMMSCCIIM